MQTDSPEDRLLRLIKGKYRKKSDSVAASSARQPFFLKALLVKVFRANKPVKSDIIKSVNMVLFFAVVILSLYLLLSVIAPLGRDSNGKIAYNDLVSDINSGITTREESGNKSTPAVDYSIYEEIVAGKDLFGSRSVLPIDTGFQGSSAADASGDLSLVGIIAGDEPQAIIEDKASQKTYYLNVGNSMNGITVTEITDGKVVLDYRGKRLVLVL